MANLDAGYLVDAIGTALFLERSPYKPADLEHVDVHVRHDKALAVVAPDLRNDCLGGGQVLLSKASPPTPDVSMNARSVISVPLPPAGSWTLESIPAPTSSVYLATVRDDPESVHERVLVDMVVEEQDISPCLDIGQTETELVVVFTTLDPYPEW